MSDVPYGADFPQGPDWWQASDDRWYPGELHPWRQGEDAGTQEPPADAVYLADSYMTTTRQGPTGRHVSRRMLVAGFVALVLVAVVGVVVGAQTAARPSASRGHVHSPGSTGAGSRSAATTTSVPGPGPTVAAVVPNPTGSSVGPSAFAALTTASVNKVFNQIWPLFAEYASEDYLPGLLSISTQGVAQVVQAQDVCGCDEFWSQYTSVEVTALTQDSYPLSFLAEVDQKDDPDGPEIQMMVFERQTAAAPWLITYDMGYAGTVPLLTSPVALGLAPTSSTPGTTPFVELASLFQSLRQTGSPLAGDIWDSLINEPDKELSDFASDLTDGYDLDESFGIDVVATFGMNDYSTAFAVPGGSMTCATITGEVITRPAQGSTMTNIGTTFGPLVPPGNYSSVTFHEAVDTCVMLVDGVYDMQGLSGGTYSATFTR